ncbi:MAG: 16S rRNA (adenine(1518)-N(6)/adenine(1519)-N(6))-dimethyltransferase RsmA [Chromatiaceae bacterium]
MPHPRKRFGQNFLQDQSVIDRIIAAVSPSPGESLVEIGPGRGAITRALLRAAGQLDAVELDRDLIEPLARTCASLGQLTIHQADALAFDLSQLVAPGEKLRLTGNLPYNISTPLLFRFLEQKACILDMHLMLQKEVVDRIVALPGSRTYGRLSVMIQTWCRAEALFEIPPQAFFPAPKVDSAFLRLTPLDPPPFPLQDPGHHQRLVTQAFAQRRKTLRNTLKGMATTEDFAALGIDPGQRAEELSVSTFASLANLTCKATPSPENCGLINLGTSPRIPDLKQLPSGEKDE